MTRPAITLNPGDSYLRDDVRVTVLGVKETHVDQWGIERFRFWARRDDTGNEGWVTFGDGGVVKV